MLVSTPAVAFGHNEKARRIVMHDSTGFSFVSEAHGWPAVSLGR
jgi:hypothetical protein